MTKKKVQDLTPLEDRILVSSDRYLNRRDPRVTSLSATVVRVALTGAGMWMVVTASGFLLATHNEEFELENTEFLENDGLRLAARPLSTTVRGVSIE